MVSERSYAYAKNVQHTKAHFRSQDPLDRGRTRLLYGANEEL